MASGQTPAQIAAWQADAVTRTGLTDWDLVRYLPEGSTAWHTATDNLFGTASYVTTSGATNGAFSVPFGEFTHFYISTVRNTVAMPA